MTIKICTRIVLFPFHDYFIIPKQHHSHCFDLKNAETYGIFWEIHPQRSEEHTFMHTVHQELQTHTKWRETRKWFRLWTVSFDISSYEIIRHVCIFEWMYDNETNFCVSIDQRHNNNGGVVIDLETLTCTSYRTYYSSMFIFKHAYVTFRWDDIFIRTLHNQCPCAVALGEGAFLHEIMKKAKKKWNAIIKHTRNTIFIL